VPHPNLAFFAKLGWGFSRDNAERCFPLESARQARVFKMHARVTGGVKSEDMRYLVRAKLQPGRKQKLLQAIENETLGQGSVAEGEYLRNMKHARLSADGTARWVEVCYCPTPLEEERPYWEEYFELTKIQDAHDRRKCRDQNGSEPWACGECDCTERLEKKLAETGKSFLQVIKGMS
jgi:hypothetical protein